ncbi:MAG TPA: shikimate dehydrogenase [Thermoleophilaceae bacterium]|nr:shikimate dehydrogenase [Thermoleophilaceae bacterium]
MTVLAGVLGHPVAHSRSPAMHNAAFRALGLDWRYVKLPVPPSLFGETVRALEGSGYRGANVTIPHKEAALEVSDEATAPARQIGAANTLTFADGRVLADNTDAGGLLDALAEDPSGWRCLILGAGGAGRAAAWALRGAGAAEVSVWNRTPGRAAALARELGVRHAASVVTDVDLLVNATSVGLDPATDPADALACLGLRGADPPPRLADLVYGPEPTALQAWAARAGARVVDGLEVLVRQGARSFEAWTGSKAPVETMRKAASN